MKTNGYKKLLTAMSTAALLVGIAPSIMAQTWTGGSEGEWTDAANWDSTTYPGESTGASPTIDTAGAEVTLSSDLPENLGFTVIGSTDAANPVTLNIQGNLSTGSSSLAVGRQADKQHAIVNHTSGVVTVSNLFLARELESTVARTGHYYFGSETSSGAPELNVSGYIGMRDDDDANMLLSLSGYGTLSANELRNWTPETANIRVQGGNLDIDVRLTRFSEGLTYTAIIDETGISTWNTDTLRLHDTLPVSGGNNVTAQFALELSNYTFLNNEEFVIWDVGEYAEQNVSNEFRNIADNDVLTVDGFDFRANYRTEGGREQFVLTAIPEPATAGMLLGVAGLMLVVLRRRLR